MRHSGSSEAGRGGTGMSPPPLEVLLLVLSALCAAAPRGQAAADAPPQMCGGAYKFMAASWANTCECADLQMVPQSNGSFCLTEPVCTRIHEPCSKQCPSCNLSVAANAQCATFDNIFEMERMIAPNIPQNADGHWFGTCTSRPQQ